MFRRGGCRPYWESGTRIGNFDTVPLVLDVPGRKRFLVIYNKARNLPFFTHRGDMSTEATQNPVWVTLSGLPLRINLEWPYKKSVTGADFYVMHAVLTLEPVNLQALAAVQLTLTVAEVLPSLEPKDTAAPTLNTLRKAVDAKELEFMKNPKRVPVPFNTRRWNLKHRRWDFGKADDDGIARTMLRRIFWETKLGAASQKVHAADPVDAQYLDAAPAHMLEIARKLAADGMIRLEGEWAQATPALMARAEEFERDRKQAQEALEKKHAFERA